MTSAARDVAVPAGRNGRTPAQSVAGSLCAIDAWHQARRRGVDGRELLSAAEQRQLEAIVASTSQQLAQSGPPLAASLCPRVVVAHHDERFVDALLTASPQAGLVVVACCWDGDRVVGFAVAEQPDALILSDELPGPCLDEVVCDVRRFSPGTLILVLGTSERRRYTAMGVRFVAPSAAPLALALSVSYSLAR